METEAVVSPEELVNLQNKIISARFKEVALGIIAFYEGKIDEEEMKGLKEKAEAKKKFGYWVSEDEQYDHDFNVALDLARIRVMKGNTCEDKQDYRLARKIAKENPSLIGLNTFDYFRQYCLFLSDHARAMREFGLIELAKQNNLIGRISLV